jgi:4-hydroxybenzoate polyprenyltransferase
MEQLKLFIELTRLKKPIGYMLLFWPCAWGLTIAYNFSDEITTYFFYLILFYSGSVLMRSAGCIVNDIFDKKLDAQVLRTKNRPIASGKISVKLAVIYTLALCSIAFIILINFNNLTIILALCSMPLAFTYPLMKRYTYWPQLFLGITFNYGLILGWTSIEAKLDLTILIFYFGAIFWTLGYDTIYGYQDIKDDEIIGIKSTSIKFKNSPKKFLAFCYFVFIIKLVLLGFLAKLSYIYYILLMFVLIHLIFYQLRLFNSKNINKCFIVFKSNNFLGLIIWIAILSGKIIS